MPTQWITDEWRLLYKNIYLSIHLQGSKVLCGVLLWEGVGDRTELQYIDHYSYAPSALCRSRSPDAQPEARGLRYLLSASFLYHILSPTGLRKYFGPHGPLRPDVAFPTTSYQQLYSNCLTSVLTELYNSSTSTQSPTRSLEWHVWSSSGGNNCHGVHRSLSSVQVFLDVPYQFQHVKFCRWFLPSSELLPITAISLCPSVVSALDWQVWPWSMINYTNT